MPLNRANFDARVKTLFASERLSHVAWAFRPRNVASQQFAPFRAREVRCLRPEGRAWLWDAPIPGVGNPWLHASARFAGKEIRLFTRTSIFNFGMRRTAPI